jgi:hypothetical protein
MPDVTIDPEKYPALAQMLGKGKPDEDDGGASVREPRRPKPAAPAMAEALEVPA